jgi:hypothetical protein
MVFRATRFFFTAVAADLDLLTEFAWAEPTSTIRSTLNAFVVTGVGRRLGLGDAVAEKHSTQKYGR